MLGSHEGTESSLTASCAQTNGGSQLVRLIFVNAAVIRRNLLIGIVTCRRHVDSQLVLRPAWLLRGYYIIVGVMDFGGLFVEYTCQKLLKRLS